MAEEITWPKGEEEKIKVAGMARGGGAFTPNENDGREEKCQSFSPSTFLSSFPRSTPSCQSVFTFFFRGRQPVLLSLSEGPPRCTWEEEEEERTKKKIGKVGVGGGTTLYDRD